MKITYWSDYACPYCYIGETYLKQAIEHMGIGEQVEVEMKAFELDPDSSKAYTGTTVDRFAKKYCLSIQGAQAKIDSISKMGKYAGLDFHYAETRYTNTFDAHRLTKLAQKTDKALADRLSERLYKAYFSEGLELADHFVLLRIARYEGLDENEVRSLLATDEFAMDVRLDEQEADRYNIHGVPYFLLDGQLTIPGALPVESMEAALRQVMDAQKGADTQGMTCVPDGCRITDYKT